MSSENDNAANQPEEAHYGGGNTDQTDHAPADGGGPQALAHALGVGEGERLPDGAVREGNAGSSARVATAAERDGHRNWTDRAGAHVVGAGINTGECQGRRLPDALASRTPEAFRDVLLAMARTASRQAVAA